MARVRRVNTAPEIAVRKALHSCGYRFRLHRNDLPGTPDIVLPRLRTAVFVHGCFWHRHEGCGRSTMPKSRVEFWQAKFAANIERDRRKVRELTELGWRSLVVWECETHDRRQLQSTVNLALQSFA
jgi:DNA mismatch endonuclease, patch repair protein